MSIKVVGFYYFHQHFCYDIFMNTDLINFTMDGLRIKNLVGIEGGLLCKLPILIRQQESTGDE